MFKDIIVGVTTREIDRCAIRLAADFARRFDSKLFLLHVPGIDQGWGAMEHLESSGEAERLKQEIMENNAELLAEVPHSEVVVHPGVPHTEILRFARLRKSDLILMGPHTWKHERMRSKMWGMGGSNLQKVSQKARCPVMIVHQKMTCQEPMFTNILVATDFSEQSDCAVNYGGQLARHYKADLTVLHVTDSRKPDPGAREKLEAEYTPRLKGLNSKVLVRQGTPSVEILETAEDRGANLIIMAHHSKVQDPNEAFFGSTTTRVAQHAPCPTMSVNRHFDLRCGLMYDQTGAVSQV